LRYNMWRYKMEMPSLWWWSGDFAVASKTVVWPNISGSHGI